MSLSDTVIGLDGVGDLSGLSNNSSRNPWGLSTVVCSSSYSFWGLHNSSCDNTKYTCLLQKQ